MPTGHAAGQRQCLALDVRHVEIMDIFEGTEQIQELVISRAISGMRIE
jgi:alkylation response protein AidB-like acyl-CoA dehydrogenase